MTYHHHQAFTLIELLVVIAIVAILSVVVILTLNPSQLLAQSRDSSRVSDMATLNSALGFFAAQGGSTFGNTSTTYISIPDPTATSTAGDQCQGLGLPALPTGDTYQCAATSTYRSTNGTGWLPANFMSLTAGSPIGALPVDPVNQTSSNLFYAYSTNGTQYEVTSILESQKYKSQFGASPMVTDYPEVISQGNSVALSELYNPSGLLGYWNFEEGSGTTLIDQSGNGNSGTWIGNTPYYAGGKVGNYVGNFDGSTDYVNMPNSGSFPPQGSISLWINATSLGSYPEPLYIGTVYPIRFELETSDYLLVTAPNGNVGNYTSSGGSSFPFNTWYHVVLTWTTSGGNITSIGYLNGTQALALARNDPRLLGKTDHVIVRGDF